MANVPFLYKQYGKRVEEFLGEYVSASGGRLELEILDPQPDTDVEEWAVKYGLAAAGLPTGEKFYLGMVAMAADKEE
ncbi:MAG TPA: Gldg family protein, partial [Candidatus Rifleibacterium sp.]|nr:Gldg family protein [Candidatus Rifleibacterium sp.]